MEHKSCLGCRFYTPPEEQNSTRGECKRQLFPHSPFGTLLAFYIYNPKFYCGEFVARRNDANTVGAKQLGTLSVLDECNNAVDLVTKKVQ